MWESLPQIKLISAEINADLSQSEYAGGYSNKMPAAPASGFAIPV